MRKKKRKESLLSAKIALERDGLRRPQRLYIANHKNVIRKELNSLMATELRVHSLSHKLL